MTINLAVIFMLVDVPFVFWALFHIWKQLKLIERNTRPEPGDIRSFVKRNAGREK